MQSLSNRNKHLSKWALPRGKTVHAKKQSGMTSTTLILTHVDMLTKECYLINLAEMTANNKLSRKQFDMLVKNEIDGKPRYDYIKAIHEGAFE